MSPSDFCVLADTLDEFWDYEHQVDLEAFSSATFYNILLKQSLSVTTRLGQLTAEVCDFKVLLGPTATHSSPQLKLRGMSGSVQNVTSDIEISTTNISGYQYQSNVSTLRAIRRLIT